MTDLQGLNLPEGVLSEWNSLIVNWTQPCFQVNLYVAFSVCTNIRNLLTQATDYLTEANGGKAPSIHQVEIKQTPAWRPFSETAALC